MSEENIILLTSPRSGSSSFCSYLGKNNLISEASDDEKYQYEIINPHLIFKMIKRYRSTVPEAIIHNYFESLKNKPGQSLIKIFPMHFYLICDFSNDRINYLKYYKARLANVNFHPNRLINYWANRIDLNQYFYYRNRLFEFLNRSNAKIIKLERRNLSEQVLSYFLAQENKHFGSKNRNLYNEIEFEKIDKKSLEKFIQRTLIDRKSLSMIDGSLLSYEELYYKRDNSNFKRIFGIDYDLDFKLVPYSEMFRNYDSFDSYVNEISLSIENDLST